jgi:hypothetical protein
LAEIKEDKDIDWLDLNWLYEEWRVKVFSGNWWIQFHNAR